MLLQDDSQDWDHMRDWLLYHLHETLDSSDDEEDDKVPATQPTSYTPRRPLQRQMSMDSGRITQRLKLGQSAGTPGSSFESNSSGGGRTSYQNSFDSTGTSGGDTWLGHKVSDK